MTEKDLRIGTLKEDGTLLEWPRYNIVGAQYQPPANRQDIGGGRFVVIPAGFTRWELVDVLKGLPATHSAEMMAKTQYPETYAFDDPGRVTMETNEEGKLVAVVTNVNLDAPNAGTAQAINFVSPPAESVEDLSGFNRRRKGSESGT